MVGVYLQWCMTNFINLQSLTPCFCVEVEIWLAISIEYQLVQSVAIENGVCK